MQKTRNSNKDYFRGIFKFFVRRAFLIPVVLFVCVGVIYVAFEIVSYVKDKKAEETYLQRKARIVDEKFNEYGLRDNKTLSDELVYTSDEMYIYTDRILYRFTLRDDGIDGFLRYIPGIRRAFPGAVTTLVPMPYRIQYEETSDNSRLVFEDYIVNIRKRLPNDIDVADCSELIGENGGRNLFYRTEDNWNMPGAYYGYLAYCNERGIEAYPEDYFILYQNNHFKGGLSSKAKNDEVFGHKVKDIIEDYDGDPFYFRLARNAKNYELVRTNEEKLIYKRPVITHAIPGSDSVVGSSIDYAIIPGNGEGTLLIITDNAGKLMAPYLAQHYETVVVFDLERYDGADYKQILAPYDITEVLIAQMVDRVGVRGYSKFLNSLME